MLSSTEMLIIPIILVWLLAITIFVIRFFFYHSKIVSDGKKESIIAILNHIIEDHKKIQQKISDIDQKYDKLDSEGLLHIQKIGLLRFNPFNDTGGDQSFILSLLDAQDNGVVISSLHTRSGTRWYAKKVVKGKGLEHELSNEEEKALREARVLKKK